MHCAKGQHFAQNGRKGLPSQRCDLAPEDAMEHCCHLAAHRSMVAGCSRLAWLREDFLVLFKLPSFLVSDWAPPPNSAPRLMLVLIMARRVTDCCRAVATLPLCPCGTGSTCPALCNLCCPSFWPNVCPKPLPVRGLIYKVSKNLWMGWGSFQSSFTAKS